MNQETIYKKLTDPTIFQENRLAPISSHHYYSSLEAAKADRTEFKTSLNGLWEFHFASNLGARVENFYQEDFDASGFERINVPGHIQLQGYDRPHYVNTMYPWDGHDAIVPPAVPKEYNPVGQYLKRFCLEEITGPTYVCFDGVETAYHVWCNGKLVGYGEGTHTPGRFDISEAVRRGNNVLAVEVYQYSTGSWLEDQDYWCFSGIFRDVSLYTVPKIHIQDLFVKTLIDETYINAILDVSVTLNNPEHIDFVLEYSLYDRDGKSVYRENSTNGIHSLIEAPRLWSAEDPCLYTLYIEVLGTDGAMYEVVKQRVGFRQIEIKNKILKINGERIVFRGVNRHDFSHVHGRAVTKAEMEWDVRFMKQNNINASRSSHYPNQTYWYELCDEYGIYVIDETNMETHGTWQIDGEAKRREKTIPDDKPEWRDAVVERANAMLQRDKNHPSIVMWSCGNESFGGRNIFEMSMMFRELDGTRPVHYEGVFHDRRYNDTSDVESRMYASPEEIERYLNNDPQKPFLLCEYTHAMGNSNGGMKRYTDLERYPMYQGGFIWDLIDQSLLAKDRYGKSFLAFGGDYGDRPTDYNFCVNGIVYGDRKASPKVQEVKHCYQSFLLQPDDKGVVITNKNLFLNANLFDLHWRIEENGAFVGKGTCVAEVRPLCRKRLDLNFGVPFDKDHEYTVTTSFVLRDKTLWADAGHEIAFGQKVLGEYKPVRKAASPRFQVNNCDVNIGIKTDAMSVIIDKTKGKMVSLQAGEKELVRVPIMPSFWKASTDNDRGNRFDYRHAQWKIASLYPIPDQKKTRIVVEADRVLCSFTYDLPTMPAAAILVEYIIQSSGEIGVKQRFGGMNGMQDMPAFGMSLSIPCEYDQVCYYGNGPEENYQDRNSGARLGIFLTTAKESQSQYVIPQECGNHTGTRWVAIYDKNESGIRFTGKTPMEFSVLPYTCHELENAGHPYNLPSIHDTVISLFSRKMGVGGDDSWGSLPTSDVTLPSNREYEFAFTMELISQKKE